MWFAALDWVIFRGPRPTPLILAGFGLGTAGMYVLVGPSSLTTGPQLTAGPVIALLVACASWALGSLYSRRADVPKSAFLATATQMLCGGAAQIVGGLLVGEGARVDPAAITLRSWLSWVYLVTFGSLLAFSCYVWLLRHASPARVSTYAYVNPIIAVFLGAMLGGEVVTLRMLLAAGLIVCAVLLITMSAQRLRKPSADLAVERPAESRTVATAGSAPE
jgi:drug/metabolite transporter (DMT)-like permease